MALWYWLTPLVLLSARVLWQMRPNLGTCCLFWTAAFLVIVVLGWANVPSQYFLSLGIASNAAVTLANGGFMPVALHRRMRGPARSLWVQRTDSQRLLFLADNFGTNFFRFSVGDVILFIGIVLSFLGY
jgi:hypothetical protein